MECSQKVVNKVIGDVFDITNTVQVLKFIAAQFTDFFSVIDGLIKSLSITQAEDASIDDAVIKSQLKQIEDRIILSDTVVISELLVVALTDMVDVADEFRKNMFKVLGERYRYRRSDGQNPNSDSLGAAAGVFRGYDDQHRRGNRHLCRVPGKPQRRHHRLDQTSQYCVTVAERISKIKGFVR